MSSTVNDTRADRLAALSILSNDERIYIQGDLQSIDLTASRLSNVSHTLQAFKRVIESLLKSEDVNDARVISALDDMSAAEEEERRHWPDDERVTFEDLIDAYSKFDMGLVLASFMAYRRFTQIDDQDQTTRQG